MSYRNHGYSNQDPYQDPYARNEQIYSHSNGSRGTVSRNYHQREQISTRESGYSNTQTYSSNKSYSSSQNYSNQTYSGDSNYSRDQQTYTRDQSNRERDEPKITEISDSELLKFYQMSTLTPQSWNDSTAREFDYDEEDIDDVDKAYGILKQLGSADIYGQSLKSIVDGPDPLGYFNSVTNKLYEKRLIKGETDLLKQKYLVNSKQFNPILFLRDLHDQDSFNTLNQSLDYLEQSIAEQSKQLRSLIRSEFVRFVKSKSSLDSVFDQIEASGLLNQKSDSLKENPLSLLSNNLTIANSKASAIIKPIVENKKKENNLKTALQIVQAHKYLFDLPKTLTYNIENNAYDSLSTNYNKGRDMYNALNDLESDKKLDEPTRKILDRVWEEVDAILNSYKKDLWDKLAETNASDNTYISIISKLLELGVEDSPIVLWINVQYTNLLNEIKSNHKKIIENLISAQKRILETVSRTDITFIYYLQGLSSNRDNLNKLSHGLVDSPEIIEMWLLMKKLIDDTVVLASNKVKQFWSVCETFLSNRVQQVFPKGYKNESQVHLKLASYEKEKILKEGEDFVRLICEGVEKVLNSTQETLSQLNEKTSAYKSNEDYEIKTPEHYGFIPPFANSISTIRYLEMFMVSVFISYNNLGNLGISNTAITMLRSSFSKILKKFIIGICSTWANDVSLFNTLEDNKITNIKNELTHSNDLIITNVDEANTNFIKFHEVDCTASLPELIRTYQKFSIRKLKDIIFIDSKLANDENLVKDKNIKIYTKPNDSFFNSIDALFLKNLEILLVSMMKKVTNENKGDASNDTEDSLIQTKTTTLDLYELWTLDNFIILEDQVLGDIINYYDQTFGTSLSKNRNFDVVKNLLPKLQTATFNNFCDSKKQVFKKIIEKGVSSTNWTGSSSPTKISGFIYECLTYLVILHSLIAKVSASLIHTIIHGLQNYIVSELYDRLKRQNDFSNGGLQQLCADLQFFRRIFNKNFKLGKTANSSLSNIIIKFVKPRGSPEKYLDSVESVVEECIEYSQYTFSCFYRE